MRRQTIRHHLRLGIALLALGSILASSCSSGTNDTAGFEVRGESSARIPVYVYNASDQTISLNIDALNKGQCRSNKWEYKGQQKETGRLDPLGPRSRLEGLYLMTATCGAARIKPYDSSDTFTLGIEGASQFKFEPVYRWGMVGAPRVKLAYFMRLNWRGNYTGGGGTHGLVQYKASNNGILGSGQPGINNNFDYGTAQQVYFTFCPQVAGQKSVPGSAIPNECRPS